VIAVGVETQEERIALTELGVHGMQGRLFDAEVEIWNSKNKQPNNPIVSSKVKLGRRNRWRN
jgi:RNase E specificity factor CsrD